MEAGKKLRRRLRQSRRGTERDREAGGEEGEKEFAERRWREREMGGAWSVAEGEHVVGVRASSHRHEETARPLKKRARLQRMGKVVSSNQEGCLKRMRKGSFESTCFKYPLFVMRVPPPRNAT
eukprot:1584260-Pleurochrysis_carterae.AAC.1